MTGILHYNNGSGWYSETLAVESVNIYSALINSCPYGTNVSFYITLSDKYGNTVEYNNSDLNYHFQIQDDIDLTNGTTVNGTVSIYISGSDEGSGLNYVNLSIGGDNISFTTFPVRYDWNSKTNSNGNIVINALMADKAGNTAEYKLTLEVDNVNEQNTTQNQNTTKTNSNPFETINSFVDQNGIAVGAGLMVALYTVFRVLKWRIGKRK